VSQASEAAGEDPVAHLASKLRELRVHAGKPSMSRLAQLSSDQGSKWQMPRSTIQDKLTGKTAPTSVEQVLALVRACAAHAISTGRPLADDEVDEARWREAWNTMQLARLAPRLQRYGAAQAAAALSAGGGADRPIEAAPQPAIADSELTRQADNLIHALANFQSNPEGIYYIGQTLVACEVFLDDHGIADPQARKLIDEISAELDNDERRSEGMFDPVISDRKVRGLIRRLRDARRSIPATGLPTGKTTNRSQTP
jgi:hypothetical protein